jgi:hypothetical protein
VTNANNAAVLRIDPASGSVRHIAVGNSPSGIAAGGGNAYDIGVLLDQLWVK